MIATILLLPALILVLCLIDARPFTTLLYTGVPNMSNQRDPFKAKGDPLTASQPEEPEPTDCDLKEASGDHKCSACGRPELTCSQWPCFAVLDDRYSN